MHEREKPNIVVVNRSCKGATGVNYNSTDGNMRQLLFYLKQCTMTCEYQRAKKTWARIKSRYLPSRAISHIPKQQSHQKRHGDIPDIVLTVVSFCYYSLIPIHYQRIVLCLKLTRTRSVNTVDAFRNLPLSFVIDQ